MMKYKKRIGLDRWIVTCDMHFLLKASKKYEIDLYDIRIKKHGIEFYAPLIFRKSLSEIFSMDACKGTTGILGYFLRSIKKPFRFIAFLCAIILWYLLSNMVFEIKIIGESTESRVLIRNTLVEMGYKTPFYDKNLDDVKDVLKKTLEKKIAWLEIEKAGSRYLIYYTPKEFADLQTLGNDVLVAKKDGVIEHFDIQHGNKEYKVNDFVHKGDTLVNNFLLDSEGKNKDIFVKGRVFAYTWKDVEVSIEDTKMPMAFVYFDMLLDARREAALDFHKDDRIYNENILQFSKDMGKIKMVIHYTLIQDITTP